MRIIRFLLVTVFASFATIDCSQNDTQNTESSVSANCGSITLHQNVSMQSTVPAVINCPNCPSRETPAIIHWLHAQAYHTGQNHGISNVCSALLLSIFI